MKGEYSLQTKLEVLDYIEKGGTKTKASDLYNISRRSVTSWWKDREDIWAARDARGVEEIVPVVSDVSVEEGLEKLSQYFGSLDAIADLETRKRGYVGVIEKMMIDLFTAWESVDKNSMKPNDLIKALKDANELREKLAGEPSVIIEYRAKYQANVLKTLVDLAPELVDDFVERMEQMEEGEYVEIT